MENRIYTGIGSRDTPLDVQRRMFNLGKKFALDGWILRSGHADGADMAFENGCDSVEGRKEIYLPHKEFNKSKSILFHIPDKAYMIASEIHEAWHRCNEFAKNAHARNVCQILGYDLKTPTNLVICWTKNGKDVGGTRTAILLARQHEIKVYNLFNM